MAPKRDARDDASLDENDGPLAQDQPQPSKKKRRLARLEEYDEDAGRARSRDFQKWAKVFENFGEAEAKKSEMFLRSFRDDVKEKEAELKAYRQKQEQEFIAGQNKFSSMFKELFDDRSKRLGSLRKEDHALFKQTQAVTADHQSLMKQANLVEKQLGASNLQLPEAEFKQDRGGFKDLLARSVSYGVALVEQILAPKLKSNSLPDQPATSKVDQLAKDLFDGSHKPLDRETWGYVADVQVNYFTVMAAMAAPEEVASYNAS